jgi:hypothetical protein
MLAISQSWPKKHKPGPKAQVELDSEIYLFTWHFNPLSQHDPHQLSPSPLHISPCLSTQLAMLSLHLDFIALITNQIALPRHSKDIHLAKLVRDGSINQQTEALNDLHSYNSQYFPEFLIPGKQGRESAID